MATMQETVFWLGAAAEARFVESFIASVMVRIRVKALCGTCEAKRPSPQESFRLSQGQLATTIYSNVLMIELELGQHLLLALKALLVPAPPAS
jgi:hypothetical protein